MYCTRANKPYTNYQVYDTVNVMWHDTCTCTYLTITDHQTTDQNFNYYEINRHGNTRNLLNSVVSAGLIPTITNPTRITDHSATLIDNIYIKLNTRATSMQCNITTDLSDHLPVFVSLGKCNKYDKHDKDKQKSNNILCRPLDDDKI